MARNVRSCATTCPSGRWAPREFGTYFIGYAATPSVTELMLRRMFLGDPPGNYDRILDFSTAVTGTLFFVPTADFLDDPPPLPGQPMRRPPLGTGDDIRGGGCRKRAGAPSDGSLGIGGLGGISPRVSGHRHDHGARARRGLLGRALSVVAARLERQPQPAARRRDRRPCARSGARRRVRRGGRCGLAGPTRVGCGGDRHLAHRPRAGGPARAGRRRATAARIEWRRVDLLVDAPEPGSFDLVSAQFMQLPPEPRARLFTALAASLRPGGTLLVVGHHPSDLGSGVDRPPMPERFYTADEIARTARRLVDRRRERGPAAVHHHTRGCRGHHP